MARRWKNWPYALIGAVGGLGGSALGLSPFLVGVLVAVLIFAFANIVAQIDRRRDARPDASKHVRAEPSPPTTATGR